MMLSVPAYGAAKQYILAEFNHPVLVDGVPYKDKQNPILSYKDRTYIPLAKIGDMTGVKYKWNAEKKQVEIGGSAEAGGVTTLVPDNGQIRDADAIQAEKKSIDDFADSHKIEQDKTSHFIVIGQNADGSDLIGFEAHDKNGKLIKTLTDEDDMQLVIASIEQRTELPPKLSDGWISDGMLTVYGFTCVYDGNELVFKTPDGVMKQQEFLRLKTPDGWKDQQSGETTINGMIAKKYKDRTYFRIDDIKKTGLIQ